IAGLLQGLNALSESEQALGRDLVRKLAAKLPPAGRGQLTGTGSGKAGAVLADLLRDALKAAPDESRPEADRVGAIRALGLATFADVKAPVPALLPPRQPRAVQAAALEALSGFDEPGVPALLFEAWPGLSPALRAVAVEVLLARPAWVDAFLDAVEQGKVNRGDVDPARIQVLQANAGPRLRARAAKLFAAAQLGRRRDVVAAYQKALHLKGDRARGKAVFKNGCSARHQLEGDR